MLRRASDEVFYNLRNLLSIPILLNLVFALKKPLHGLMKDLVDVRIGE